MILVSLKDVLSDGKVPKLRWEYAAKWDLLPIPHTGSSCLFLGKQELYCHQGKDFNLSKKEKYFAEKNNQMKSDHIWKKSRKNIQPTKKEKFVVKKIFRFTKYNLLNDTKKKQKRKYEHGSERWYSEVFRIGSFDRWSRNIAVSNYFS